MSAPNSDREPKEAPCPRRLKPLLQCILHWFKRLILHLNRFFYRTRPTSLPFDPVTTPSPSQTIHGNRNQVIGSMSGNAMAIANVNKLTQHFHLPP